MSYRIRVLRETHGPLAKPTIEKVRGYKGGVLMVDEIIRVEILRLAE